MELTQTAPDMSMLPGGWEPFTNIKLDPLPKQMELTKTPLKDVMVLDNIFSEDDIFQLVTLFNSSPYIAPVGVNGFMDTASEKNIGSKRTTMWAPQLAEEVWKKIDIFLSDRKMGHLTATDWWQGEISRYWKPVGASPMMRFMKYEKGGEHFAHYDMGYIYPDPNFRTLKSYVIYLTTNEDGGATRFINDGQEKVPIWDRNTEDWTREAREDEVIFSVQPKMGRILLFDHRLCHDVQQFLGNDERMIIRGDIIYQADEC